MQDNFLNCLAFIWRGDTDGQALHHDPKDRGGATAYGVTLATYTAWREAHGIHTTTKDDLGRATEAELAAMFQAWFWTPPRCDALPLGVDLMAFDIAVGSGTRTAAMLVQRACGVKADGVVGRVTLEAINRVDASTLINALHFGWLGYCKGIREPGGWATYANGWTNRANKRLAAARKMIGKAPAAPPPVTAAPVDAISPTDLLNLQSLHRAQATR